MSIYSAEPVVTTPAYLASVAHEPTEVRQQLKNCNIYVICTRVRIAFDPATLRINEERKLAGSLVLACPEGTKTSPFVGRTPLPDEFLSVSTAYPFTKVDAHGEGDARWGLPNFLLLPDLNFDIDGQQNLEVVYVGQAFGTAGERTAVERLSSHSTLQKILADTAADEPHKEVLLLLYSFDFHRFYFTMDGRNKAQVDGDDDRRHWHQAMAADFKRGMRISLAEAALIRHFEPRYNK
ncbi:MAG: hypothetical protein EON54_14565, partial [Alcaligenaceae bacterium]